MIIDELKKVALTHRKNKTGHGSFLLFVISEVEKIGKNIGNRATTDDEAVKVLQKTIENLKLNVEYLATQDNEAELVVVKDQIAILEPFIPQMASEAEIIAVIDTLPVKDKKSIAAALKKTFGTRVDIKKALEIATV